MYERLRQGAATPTFVDSGAVVAYHSDRDQHRDAARAFFDGLRTGDIRARPLYTSEYVVDEVATTLLANAGHDRAAEAVRSLRQSAQIHVLHVDPVTFDTACDRFVEYDDLGLSFTDHVIGLQARDRGVDVVLTFDRAFEALGLQTVPKSG